MMTAAEEIFASMQDHGPAPDLVSYNTMLAGYAQVIYHTNIQQIKNASIGKNSL